MILRNEEELNPVTPISITLAIYEAVFPFICFYNWKAVLQGQEYYDLKMKEAETYRFQGLGPRGIQLDSS